MKPSALSYHDVEVPPEVGDTGTSKVLPFRMQVQQATEWCWAACAVSLADWYTPVKEPRRQCELVNAVLPAAIRKGDACAAEVPESCNQANDLVPALEEVGLASKSEQGPTPFETLVKLVESKEVPAVLVAWNGGWGADEPHKKGTLKIGGHFVAIVGYGHDGGEESWIAIADSLYEDTHMPYSEFPDRFHGGANWNYTYVTGPTPGPAEEAA